MPPFAGREADLGSTGLVVLSFDANFFSSNSTSPSLWVLLFSFRFRFGLTCSHFLVSFCLKVSVVVFVLEPSASLERSTPMSSVSSPSAPFSERHETAQVEANQARLTGPDRPEADRPDADRPNSSLSSPSAPSSERHETVQAEADRLEVDRREADRLEVDWLESDRVA